MITKIVDKIEALMRESEPFLLKAKTSERSLKARNELRAGEYSAYTTSVLNFLCCFLDRKSPYILEFEKNAMTYSLESIQNGVDILKRLSDDVKDGWIIDLKGLISADIFNDFLDMAKHLLDENYKDPAAVIIGSVLEKHLRNLCLKNGITTTTVDTKGKAISKKASMLNDALLKNGLYNILEQKNVIAWLDLRNKAAHGMYSDYDLTQVKNLHQGVFDFIVRNPL